jgi:amidohydrolase
MKDLVDSALSALSEGRSDLFELAAKLKSTPELGFFEAETAAILAEALARTGALVTRGIALSGLRAEFGPKGAPSIFLLADMDALPTQGSPGGVAHSCGHHAQMAVLAAVFRALAESGVAEKEGVRLVYVATPAEEYVDLQRRLSLREQGKTRYLSGKQEMLALGVFDDADVVLKYHSMSDSGARQATVNGILNGFVARRAEFTGKAAHAGAHPDEGINALNAANLALQAIHSQRETFKDDNHIRVHPILTEGGTVVNSVPARAVIETYIRGATARAIAEAAAKVDRAFCSGALAVGASVKIRGTPGYKPFRPSAALGEVLGRAAAQVVPMESIDFHDSAYASDDIGDIASLFPTCQLGFSGFSGTIHSCDFEPASPERAYFAPAEILLRTVLELAAGKGEKIREIKAGFRPEFTKSEYLASLDADFQERDFEGASPRYS